MKEKTKEILKDIGGGAAMGIGAAIPGVSGGTIAMQAHVYDRHLSSMSNIKKNLLTLLPLFLGILLGFIPMIILFKKAFEGFTFGIISLFAGLIIGGLPGIFDNVKKEKKTPKLLIILIVATLIVAGLGLLSGILALNGSGLNLFNQFNMKDAGGMWIDGGHVSWWLYPLLIPIGMIVCSAFILPGISGSMILLILGFYNPILATLEWVKQMFQGQASGEQIASMLGIYGCLLLGIILGFLTTVKLLNYLFNKHKLATYYAILGFIFGSLFSLFFNNQIVSYYQSWAGTGTHINTYLSMPIEITLGGVLLVVGLIVSYLFVRVSRKKQN